MAQYSDRRTAPSKFNVDVFPRRGISARRLLNYSQYFSETKRLKTLEDPDEVVVVEPEELLDPDDEMIRKFASPPTGLSYPPATPNTMFVVLALELGTTALVESMEAEARFRPILPPRCRPFKSP